MQTPFTTKTFVRVAAAVLAAASLSSLTGCISRSSGDPNRLEFREAEVISPDAWPARNKDKLDDLVLAGNASTPITRLVLDGSVPDDELPADLRRAATRPAGEVVYARRFGQGLIRGVRDYSRGRPRYSTRFVSFSTLDERPSDQRIPQMIEKLRDEGVLPPQGAAGVRVNDPQTLGMLYEGTEIRITRPRGRKPVGLVVHMAGLGSMKWEQPVLDELQNRGWAVLRIFTPSVWWYDSKPINIATPADIDPTGQRLARTIDDLVAEPAYAAEAALQWMRTNRAFSDIPQSPLVMVGCSAGALATPAVVARMPDKFDAVVLVGAGANLLRLSQTSDLTDAGIHLNWGDEAAAQKEKLFSAYLNASHLDPFHTAKAMTDKPVLMIQAALDSTVSASGGDLLWEQLGRPERWTFSGGHRLLFWRLADHSSAIADWIAKATEKPRLPNLQAMPTDLASTSGSDALGQTPGFGGGVTPGISVSAPADVRGQ